MTGALKVRTSTSPDVWTTIAGGVTTFASDAEVVAGVETSKAVSPATLKAGIAAKQPFIDVRSYGAVGDGVTDDTVAIQAALDAVGTSGGIVTMPEGTFKISNTLLIDSNYTRFEGQATASTKLSYTGSGIAINVTKSTGLYGVELRNFEVNTSTGTIGIQLGAQTTMHWRHTIEHVNIIGFTTYGLYQDHTEQVTCTDVFASACGIGFRITSDVGGSTSMANGFYRCRAQDCINEGWWIDDQICPRFIQCEALNCGGLANFRVAYMYQGVIDQLDIEETSAAHTKLGLRFLGEHTYISVASYGLLTGVSILSSIGVMFGPSRFSSTTTPLSIGSGCTVITVVDDGNLGTVANISPIDEVHYIGNQLSSEVVRVSGAAGAGYLELMQEQSADPAAPSANRCRLFIKDNGSGKTQLMARFATGASVQVAIEP